MRKRRNRLHFERIEVIDAGSKGKAVAKAPDGRAIFINNAVPGDVVDVQTTKKRKNYFEGTVTNFHTLSNRRVQPECEHFGVCGGCKWQHMGYKHQLHFKQKEVLDHFSRIGHLDFPDPLPILGSKKQYEYRNKLEFSFSDSRWLSQDEIDSSKEISNRTALGFHIPGMWDKILDINRCHLQVTPSNEIRLAIKAYADNNGLSFFSPRNKSGMLRTLMIRTSTTGDLMVLIQFFEDQPEKRKSLLQYVADTFPKITSLLYVINNKANDTIYDQEVLCFKGEDHINEEMEGLKFRIGPKSFYQTNSEQAYELYKIARDFADLQGEETVYDLYTGTGTIALFIARQAKKVVGIDSVPEAINSAKYNAGVNEIHNTEFYAGDMREIFNEQFVKQNGTADLIITDPPREGMHKKVIEQILRLSPPKIVYVSCNTATQARDLALLNEHYIIKKLRAVDMFPQTHHVENVVLLEKRIQ